MFRFRSGRRAILFKMAGFIMVYLTLSAGLTAESQTAKDFGIMTWSPDGDRIAVGYRDGTIKIWDAPSTQVIYTFAAHSDTVSALAWSPDGKRLLSGSVDSSASVWDTETYSLPALKTWESYFITAVAWSPDNSKIIIYDFGGSEYFYNSQDYSLIRSHSTGTMTGLAWSPDGTMVAFENIGASSMIYDTASWEILVELRDDEVDGDNYYALHRLVWGQNTSRIAGGTYGGGIVIWDAPTGSTLKVLRATENEVIGRGTSMVHALRFSDDDTRLSSLSGDGTLRVFDTLSGESIGSMQLAAPIYAAAWSPDGTQIAYGDEDGTLFIIPTPPITLGNVNYSER